jgi:hypothetical protein
VPPDAASIEPGRYLAVRTTGWSASVIRWATHAKVNHAAVVLPGQRVAEAEPGGAVISPLAKYHGCYARANLAEPVTGRQLTQVWQAAEAFAQARTAYNWAAIGDDAAVFLGWHWRLLLAVAASDHDLDCSQMVAMCGQAAGADWLCGRPSYSQVTPGDLDSRPGMVRVAL